MGRTSDYKLIIHCMILSKHTAQNSHGVAQKAANCGERTKGLSETYNLTNVPKVPHGITVSLLAFGVFYIRRFGLLYVGLGLYTLFIYMFGTIVANGRSL